MSVENVTAVYTVTVLLSSFQCQILFTWLYFMYFISFSRPQAGEEPGWETVTVLISQAKLITIFNFVRLFFLCTPDKSVNKF